MLLCFIAILLSEKLEHGLLAYIYWAHEELKAKILLQLSLKMYWQIYLSPSPGPKLIRWEAISLKGVQEKGSPFS